MAAWSLPPIASSRLPSPREHSAFPRAGFAKKLLPVACRTCAQANGCCSTFRPSNDCCASAPLPRRMEVRRVDVPSSNLDGTRVPRDAGAAATGPATGTDAAAHSAADGCTALLVDARAAAALLGVGRATWWKLHASGRVPAPLRFGRRTLWRRAELERWIAADAPA
ncbi:MAG: DNA-binding protein, partial [Planctomycetota bacterium]